jgi:hypothetical protein
MESENRMRKIMKDVRWLAEMSLAIVLMSVALVFFTAYFKVRETVYGG